MRILLGYLSWFFKTEINFGLMFQDQISLNSYRAYFEEITLIMVQAPKKSRRSITMLKPNHGKWSYYIKDWIKNLSMITSETQNYRIWSKDFIRNDKHDFLQLKSHFNYTSKCFEVFIHFFYKTTSLLSRVTSSSLN